MVRVFKQYIPASLLILAALEFVLLMLCVYAGVGLRFVDNPQELVNLHVPEDSVGVIYPKALTYAFVMILALGAMGLYQRRFRHGIAGMFLRAISGFVLGSVGLTLVYYAYPDFQLGRGIFAWTIFTSIIVVTVLRTVFIKTVDQNLLKKRVMVLGSGELASQIGSQLRRRTDQRGFHIVAYIHVSGEEDVVNENLIIRPEEPLLSIATQLQVDEVVVAVSERRRRGFPVHELLDCKLSGIDVIDLQSFFEREVGKLKLDILNPSWLIFSDGFGHSSINIVQKRTFDLLVSLLLLLVTWPFMLLVALAVKLEDGGPVFYKQIRVGQHWKLFHVYKFRSMGVDAEAKGAQWAKKGDSRVTKVGALIRKTRLDELPQIFNVIKGDMSFVGPRPERPEFVTGLSEKIPYFAERHRVKPGITGWAQVCYPYGASEKDSLEKLQYDMYYIKNYSLFLDLVIILQTAHEIVWGRGAR